MSATRVGAVVLVHPERPDLAVATLAALDAQSRPPDRRVLVVPDGTPAPAGAADDVVAAPRGARTAAGFAAGLAVAVAGGDDWLWLLDGVTVPEPDALAGLLDVLAKPPSGRIVLLASKVVDDAGRLHADALPWPEFFDRERAVDGYARRLALLRGAEHGSLLVQRTAAAAAAPPRAAYVAHGDGMEWTLRLLRGEQVGYWVPGSVAVRGVAAVREGRARRRDRSNRARTLASSAWSPTEKLWAGLELALALGADARSALRRAGA